MGEVSWGGAARPSFRTRVQAAATELELTVVGIEVRGKPVVIAVQDTLDDGGESSAEAQRVMELLCTTVRIAE